MYYTSGGSLYRHYLGTMMRGLFFFSIIIPEKIINSSLAGTDLLYIK